MWTLIAGIFIGIILTIWAEWVSLERDNIKDFVKKKLPHKKGEIVGLSEAEQNFQDSLDNSFRDKKIN